MKIKSSRDKRVAVVTSIEKALPPEFDHGESLPGATSTGCPLPAPPDSRPPRHFENVLLRAKSVENFTQND